MSKAVMFTVLLAHSLAVGASAQSTITLRGAARVPAAAPITLADVAGLVGPDAEALARIVVIAPESRGARVNAPAERVDADLVRRAIDEQTARNPVNWGRMTIAGGTCVILPPLDGSRPVAGAAAPHPVAAPYAGSVRAVVAARIAQMLAAEPSDLKLTFDDSDRDVLDLAAVGRTVDVRAAGVSERMPMQVTVYENAGTAGAGGGRIVAGKTVRVGVQVRRPIVLAAGPKRRGEIIGPSDVAGELRWVGPAVGGLTPDRVIGSAVRSRLTPGAVVTAQDVEPPLVVEKGELVSVHCVSGAIVVRMTARALAPARDGEIVRLQSMTDEDRTFYARMNGRGRAVAVTQDSPEVVR
ncbi:MAG: flagellar basal body P-ring formation chaperone FlgA [Phycisphaerales bacterium]